MKQRRNGVWWGENSEAETGGEEAKKELRKKERRKAKKEEKRGWGCACTLTRVMGKNRNRKE